MDLKENLQRETVTLKNGVVISFKKLPAIKGALLFTNIISKIKELDIDLNMFAKAESASQAVGLIQGLLDLFDDEYIEQKLMPKLFDYVEITSEQKGLTKFKLSHALKDENVIIGLLNFDDILEILVRSLCVNFLALCLARLSTLKEKK